MDTNLTTTSTPRPSTTKESIDSDENDYDGYDIWDDYFEIPEPKNLTSIKSNNEDTNKIRDGSLF